VQKYLIFCMGDKGGVGKSFFCRTLADLVYTRSPNLLIIDGDPSNHDLQRFFKGKAFAFEMVNITKSGAMDGVLDRLGQEQRHILIDFPARCLDLIINLVKDLDVVDICTTSGYRILICHVMSKSYHSTATLKQIFDMFQDRVAYMIVRNLLFGDTFPRYDESRLRQDILALGGVEINLPELFWTTADFAEDKSLLWSEIINSALFPPTIRSRANSWFTALADQLKDKLPFWSDLIAQVG